MSQQPHFVLSVAAMATAGGIKTYEKLEIEDDDERQRRLRMFLIFSIGSF
jgi:hypothetical protein